MTEWTKTSDEMPPKTGDYLLFTDAGKIRTGSLNEVGLYADDHRAWQEKITHWAEMPEPPVEHTSDVPL
jgi:hypothetical protein